MNRLILILVPMIAILDQISKYLISRYLYVNESVEVVRKFFHLTLVHNTGAAFGILRDQTALFILISVLAVVSILFYLRKRKNLSLAKSTGFGLILAGSLSNLIDRLRFGYVIDFLDFRIWPVFNIADSAITIGAFLLIISFFKKTLNSKP